MKTWIVVPSRERAFWLMNRKNHTLKYLQGFGAFLYVRDDDSQLERYKEYAKKYDANFLLQDSSALGAAQTYDSLIDMAIEQNVIHLIILDDDLFFCMPNPIPGAKPDFPKCNRDAMQHMLSALAYLPCPEMPAMSICPIMKRTQNYLINFAQPLMWGYAYYVPHFKYHPEHRFWKGRHIEARCDLNITLQLLTDGFLTSQLCSFFIPDNVNNPGGCSTYRSIELERSSVEYLKKTYPKFITTRLKKGWIEGEDIIREAPFVQWKQAMNKIAFKNHFGVDANKFARDLLDTYEHDYNNFLIAYRGRYNGQKKT